MENVSERAMEEKILRIIDANFNRAREGLRVCEEVVRFSLGERSLTESLKSARHELTAILRSFPGGQEKLLKARDSSRDVGKDIEEREKRAGGYREVLRANIQRVKESLRVLEEFGKTVDPKIAGRFKALRFQVYDFEKQISERLASLPDT